MMPKTATRNMTSAIDVARSFFASYHAHDVDQMVAACSEDARLHYVPLGSQGEGKARELGRSFWSSLIDAFPDLHVVVESVFGDERHVAAEVVIGGTQQKDFLQIPNQGRQFESSHAFNLEISDGGKISGITAYWDLAKVYSDLGKTTLP